MKISVLFLLFDSEFLRTGLRFVDCPTVITLVEKVTVWLLLFMLLLLFGFELQWQQQWMQWEGAECGLGWNGAKTVPALRIRNSVMTACSPTSCNQSRGSANPLH